MGLSKRGSGTPRRPRNPVAKAVRTPAFKQQVVPDKRWRKPLKEKQADPPTISEHGADGADDGD